MAESLTSLVKVTQSVSPVSQAAGGFTETAVNCTGFSRAMHIVNVGTCEHETSSLNASVWESATSGGTYTLISGTLSTIGYAGASESYAIDVPVNNAKPYQKCISTAADGWVEAGAVAILYAGSGNYPKTQENTAVVV